MERRTFSKAQIYVRETYNQAAQLAAKRNYERAIEILIPVVKTNPEVPMLFERLREYEIAREYTLGFFARFLGNVLGLLAAPWIRIVSIFNPVKAMAMCEGILAISVNNTIILKTLAAAADSCEAPWIAATALNVIKVFHPDNESNLRALAFELQLNGQANRALRIFNDLAHKYPDNLAVQAECREAMALASMERGRWEEEGSTQNKAADKDDAVLQQLLEGTIHDESQAEVLINKFTEDLKSNDSIDVRRKLADAYMVAKKYDEALQEYRKVAEMLKVQDPLLDKLIENAYVAGLQQSVEELQAHPESYEDAENQAKQILQEIRDYRRRHAFQRAKAFPNDMQLKYDLGALLFDYGELAEARTVFKEVVKSPQKQRGALVFLAKCDMAEHNYAAGVRALEKALAAMYRMDKYKREALYCYAVCLTETGEKEKALDTLQMIYANVPNYMDVEQRIRDLGGEPGKIVEKEVKKEEDY